jgi:hypothetical protein
MVSTVMRVYSYIYHLILGLLMLGVSVVVLSGGSNNLRLGMLPWTGQSLTRALLWGGILALLCVLLAITGWFRFLFPIWALAILIMMVRGYLLGSYAFSGRSEFNWVLVLIGGSLLAFFGSLSVFGARRQRRA